MGGKRLAPKDCLACGETFQPKSGRAKYCGTNCALAVGRQNKLKTDPRGYVDKQGAVHHWINGKDVREHRLVYERTRGVKLQSWHLVSHKDGNKSNNDPSNLTLRNKDLEELVQRTGKLPKEAARLNCPKCGQKQEGSHIVNRTGKTVLFCRPCESKRQRASYARKDPLNQVEPTQRTDMADS